MPTCLMESKKYGPNIEDEFLKTFSLDTALLLQTEASGIYRALIQLNKNTQAVFQVELFWSGWDS